MKDIAFFGAARAGGYTALMLRQVGNGLCITLATDVTPEVEVSGWRDMDNRKPLVNVEAEQRPAQVLLLWAQLMGSVHLVDLLRQAVERCPDRARHTASIMVHDERYTITRLIDGMHLQGPDAELTLRGAIVTRTNRERWLYLKGLTRPPRDDDR